MSNKSGKKPSALWILMYEGYDGWFPSADYPFVWRTKKAALRKIKSLGERGKVYRAFKYEFAKTPWNKKTLKG